MTSESRELSPRPRLATWRYFVALVIVGSYPLVSAFSTKMRGDNATKSVGFPSTVPDLLKFAILQMLVFGAFWSLAWAFSRYDKKTLFLQWKDGVKPILWGAFYYASLYLSFILLIGLLIMAMLMFGSKEADILNTFRQIRPQTQGLTDSISANKDPIYRFLILTLIPFIVAGLREELWRGATLAGLKHICPPSWSQPMQNVFAVALSSVVFGLGHLYQGPSGIVVTGILGMILGIIVLRHGSIWPAVFMHGFIDAVSFAMASFGAVKN